MRQSSASSWRGVIPLSVPCVPTGMNTGVSTSACGKLMTAARALLTGHSAKILKASAARLLLLPAISSLSITDWMAARKDNVLRYGNMRNVARHVAYWPSPWRRLFEGAHQLESTAICSFVEDMASPVEDRAEESQSLRKETYSDILHRKIDSM